MKLEILIHDFEKDLEWSELPLQYITYMQSIVHWWPDVIGWERITDLLQQKKGKDITINLPNEIEVRLQFKSRRKFYGDFCIEYRHDYPNGYTQPGWIEKESDADYLIYCVPGYVYRINYKQLHTAWEENKDYWKVIFDIPPAKNANYDTRNVAIQGKILEDCGVEINCLKLTNNT